MEDHIWLPKIIEWKYFIEHIFFRLNKNIFFIRETIYIFWLNINIFSLNDKRKIFFWLKINRYGLLDKKILNIKMYFCNISATIDNLSLKTINNINIRTFTHSHLYSINVFSFKSLLKDINNLAFTRGNYIKLNWSC